VGRENAADGNKRVTGVRDSKGKLSRERSIVREGGKRGEGKRWGRIKSEDRPHKRSYEGVQSRLAGIGKDKRVAISTERETPTEGKKQGGGGGKKKEKVRE